MLVAAMLIFENVHPCVDLVGGHVDFQNNHPRVADMSARGGHVDFENFCPCVAKFI